jgi:hypothetical protein
MPINIYRDSSPEYKIIAWLCDGDWDLSNQVETLAIWLENDGSDLPVGEYVADIGFCWRRDAMGGGAVLPPKVMKQMSEIGMCLFLSEYSGFSDSDF